MLFNVGEPCQDIFIILSGVIDIVITDGGSRNQTLDVLGKGSIIGPNFVLRKSKWFYKAVNKT